MYRMRKFLTLILLIAPLLAFSGNSLGDQVEEMMMRIDSCTSASQIGSIITEYKDIAKDYGTNWRSHYWLAYANMKKAEYTFDDANKDRALDEAMAKLKPAILLNRENSEVLLLEALILWKRIAIDTESRENKYTYLMEDLLTRAFKAEQLNPRYYYIKGAIALSDTIMNPENKGKAREYFLSGEKVYGPYTANAVAADPKWGYSDMRLYLNVLYPNRNFFYTRNGEYVEGNFMVETLSELKEIEKELKKEEKAKKKAAKDAEKAAKQAAKAEQEPKFLTEKDELAKDIADQKAKEKSKKEAKKEKKDKPKKEKKVRNLPW